MKQQTDFVISKLNIHRLIVTSMMLAVKFFDDTYYSNAYYAKVGGVKAPEMNVLEIHFLRLIDWHLFVSPEEFDLYKTNVLIAVAGSPAPSPALSPHQSSDTTVKPSLDTTAATSQNSSNSSSTLPTMMMRPPIATGPVE
jgi:hypothetical protein